MVMVDEERRDLVIDGRLVCNDDGMWAIYRRRRVALVPVTEMLAAELRTLVRQIVRLGGIGQWPLQSLEVHSFRRFEAEESLGSLEGRLEQVKRRNRGNIFDIYPAIGPKRVECHVPPQLIKDAVAALGCRVEVYGSIKYRDGEKFPHQLIVDSIEVTAPEDDVPPDWRALRGFARNSTGGLSSEAFVRRLRDNEWR